MYSYIGFALFFIIFYLIFFRRHKVRPNQEFRVRKANEYDFKYVTKDVQVPVTQGFILKLGCKLVNSLFGKLFLVGHIASKGSFDIFRSIKISEHPTFYPYVPFSEEAAKFEEKPCSDEEIEKLLQPRDDDVREFTFHTASCYLGRYRAGTVTPSAAAERILIGLKETEQLRAVVKHDPEEVRRMAAASTDRYKSNSTLSPIDGVFVVLKDEFAVKGFTYSKGTSFMGSGGVSTYDSALVEKLRSLGAIIVGIANMHELGLGTTGNNSNKGFGTCRNPYNVNHYTGGSSSGCASAVAAGLCSMGLGSDGGGSIRIPSSYCGVVGLKPTFGRFNYANTTSLSNTVGHAGPICANVRDAAVFYTLLAGPHPGYELGMLQPKIKLPDFSGNLKGIKIGIDRRYFRDCQDDVYGICNRSLDLLTKSDATIENIEIPELFEVIQAHRIAILSEMTCGVHHDFDVNFDQLTPAARVFFRLGHSVRATDYLQANKQRTRTINFFKQLFEKVDAIVLPTAAHCAPEIRPSELSAGMLNPNQDSRNMRFSGLGNFTGCPAISIPVGYNDAGLPVGLQFLAAWWKEDLVLKIAECVERQVALRKPKVFADILD